MKNENEQLTLLLSQLQAIAQSGKFYTRDVYDQERYEQLEEVSKQLLSSLTTASPEQLKLYFANDTGYVTPKVDVRAVTFQEDKILLVQEKATGTWSLPGGWADIGYSPSEIAAKETWEEAGIKVKPQRLIAIYDMAKHPYQEKSFNYIYKLFFECSPLTQVLHSGVETSSAAFFSLSDALSLDLSLNRNLPADIQLAFKSRQKQDWQTKFD
ncbi:NUDIX family hydrolase [Ligilactobacillus salitolerans]|uniref:NUDIX family hydrolase n=1 Tax=Ligilactobacillus salitolerans TaxID=1808352 RepID=A0A401IUP0_9LACO|nr:NUDIX hydrolase [Ligilactobacillus salitolerans]GBG95273.1 NUDIX family hydrolase [Ligilactobacillus salitolerans]